MNTQNTEKKPAKKITIRKLERLETTSLRDKTQM